MTFRNSLLVVFCIGFVLFCVQPSPAQPIAQVSDATCTAAGQNVGCTGAGTHNCERTTFSIQSTLTVTLRASLTNCTPVDCHCGAEAYIYVANTTQLVACVSTSCTTAQCPARSQQVQLQAGNYDLYACKIDCDGDGCDDCSTDCHALATVDAFP